jgi:hypothetical protein
MGLMLVFVLAQAMYLGRFMDKGENPDVPPESKP